MRYSLMAVDLAPDGIVPVAQAAERAGFHALGVGDHPVRPVRISSRYPYRESGKSSTAANGPVDPWVAAGAVLAATNRLHFLTALYLPLLRHPLLTLRAAADASALSAGRLLLGLGLGWMCEEFAALAQPFARRGDRFDELLDVLNRGRAGGTMDHHGEFYDIPPVRLDRVPAPLYLGGHANRMVARPAAHADGWICPPVPGLAARQAATLAQLRAAAGTAGRPFEIVALARGTGRDDLCELAAAGVGHVLVPPPWRTGDGGDADRAAQIHDLGRHLADATANISAVVAAGAAFPSPRADLARTDKERS